MAPPMRAVRQEGREHLSGRTFSRKAFPPFLSVPFGPDALVVVRETSYNLKQLIFYSCLFLTIRSGGRPALPERIRTYA